MNITQRNIGVNISNNDAEVCIWAPLAKNVSLLVNDHIAVDLSRSEPGYWNATTNQVKERDKYYVIVDDKKLPDITSLSQPDGVHGASEAIDLSYKWTDDRWKNIPLKDYIIYELHTGTFTPEATFQSIEQKLDYLIELGVTAIELMPVAQFSGKHNWGYDGVFPFAVHHTYGGAKALQQLVDACHKKGLAVILDVVYNHIGPEGNYLGEFAPYFTGKYNTPWGDAINFDDAHCDGVRQFFIENALMWLRDFHIDALRLDAVHAIKDFSPVHILRELKMRVDGLMKETGRTHYLIAECDLNDTKFLEPLDEKGYAMDAQWSDEFHHALRVATGQKRNGYYSEFNGLQHLAKSYKDAYVFTGEYSTHRNKSFGTKTDAHDGSQFIVFSQNHDQVGNRMLGERTSALLNFEQQKLVAAAVMISPFLPLLFMGEEYGETNPFLYFVDHGDEDLKEAVRKGRKEEFKQFHADGEAPDPTDADTFRKSQLQWDLLKNDHHQTMFQYYRSLISLRKKHSCLNNGDRRSMNVEHDGASQTLLIHRWHDSEHIIAVMNFSGKDQSVKVPECKKTWKSIFDSADEKWNGPGASANVVDCGTRMNIKPHSVVVYTNCYV